MSAENWLSSVVCPLPENEEARLEALSRYESESAPLLREKNFDRLVNVAARVCGMPIAFIHILTRREQLPKASFGFSYERMPRNLSFCQFTILQDGLLEIEDAAADERFSTHPQVNGGELNIRFYAGVPLQTEDGHNIGTLCVIDHKPNKLTEEMKQTLFDLAAEIVDQYELKRTKEALEQNNREKDQLIRVISHDLRNPLLGIIGFAEYLKLKSEDEEHIQLLSMIEDAGQSIMRLVNIMLNSDYIRNQAFSLSAAPSDVAALTREVVQMLEPYIKLKRQKLELRFPESLDFTLDPEKWKQITGNLLTNASKFTPDEGHITLSLSNAGPGKPLVLRVEDNGTGMTEETVKNLFSARDSIRRNGTNGEASSGLGMQIVKRFSDLHGASIEVDSEPGRGTAIEIALPTAG
jgi:signal transduction histidine kinase